MSTNRCEVEQALGGGFFKCDRPVSPKGNGAFCEFHGAQTAAGFDVELTECGKAHRQARRELAAVRQLCLDAISMEEGGLYGALLARRDFAYKILQAIENAE